MVILSKSFNISGSVTDFSKPSSINIPFPPASTTPASFNLGNKLGVFSTASLATFFKCTKNGMKSSEEDLYSIAASATFLITVKIVPSTGSLTAL